MNLVAVGVPMVNGASVERMQLVAGKVGITDDDLLVALIDLLRGVNRQEDIQAGATDCICRGMPRGGMCIGAAGLGVLVIRLVGCGCNLQKEFWGCCDIFGCGTGAVIR